MLRTRSKPVYHRFTTFNTREKVAQPVGRGGKVMGREDLAEGSAFAEASLGSEEIAEDAGAALSKDAADDLGAMVEARIAGDSIEAIASAGLRIGGAVNHDRNPCLDDGPGAHGAGFESDIKETIFQAPGVQCLCRLGDGDHLGVGGRIDELFALVVRPADDALAQMNDDAANGHLVLVGGLSGFFEGHLHVVEVEGVARVGQRQIEGGQFHLRLPDGVLFSEFDIRDGLSRFLLFQEKQSKSNHDTAHRRATAHANFTHRPPALSQQLV